MGEFFKYLGAGVFGCFALIVIVGVAGFVYLRFQMKKLGRAVETMGGLIPHPKLTLQPYAKAWDNEKERAEIERQFLAENFIAVHTKYRAEENSILFQAFYSTERNAYGVIYELPHMPHAVDIFRSHEDGTELTVSNQMMTDGVTTPWSTTIRIDTRSVSRLLKELDLNPPSEKPIPVTEEGFKPTFEASYARSIEYRYS